MAEHNRVIGEKNGLAKLTEEQVLEIRAKYKRGVYGQIRLAKEFNVSPPTIMKIVNRITWNHLDEVVEQAG